MAEKVRLGRLSDRHQVKARLRAAELHTVCEEARCPNMSECFRDRTATFLILGDACTRRCRFCAIGGVARPPRPPDPQEPERLARTAAVLGMRHVVITSVTRDDLPDGGATHFVACIEAVRRTLPQARIEVLVPDFCGNEEAGRMVFAARPEVFNHNVETVPRLYPGVRPGADVERSLRLLERAAGAGLLCKSGLMVGLGESDTEVCEFLAELSRRGCRVVTIGQYLRPRRECLPVARRVEEASFAAFRQAGEALSMRVIAGPRVRSSYHARAVFEAPLAVEAAQQTDVQCCPSK
ncbi:MAG: lipoyl synthase [Myxococcales bacterium]|nr:lipoyl synthase [Myxococcales bacterium]